MSDRITPADDRYVIGPEEGARPISGTELVPARLRKYFTRPAFQIGALVLFFVLVICVCYFKATNKRGDGKDSFWQPVTATINKMAQDQNPKVVAFQAKPKKDPIKVVIEKDGVWSPSNLYFRDATATNAEETMTFRYIHGTFDVIWYKDAEAPEDPPIQMGPSDYIKPVKHFTSPVWAVNGLKNGPLIIEITPN